MNRYTKLLYALLLLLCGLTLPSCRNKALEPVEDLNGSVWVSMYTDEEFKKTRPETRAMALCFGKHEVDVYRLDRNYNPHVFVTNFNYSLKGTKIDLGGTVYEYNPTVIDVLGRYFVRQKTNSLKQLTDMCRK